MKSLPFQFWACIARLLKTSVVVITLVCPAYADKLEMLISHELLVDGTPVRGVLYLRSGGGSLERRSASVAPKESSRWVEVGTLLRDGDETKYLEYCFEVLDSQGGLKRTEWMPVTRRGGKLDEEREGVASLRERVMELRRQKSEAASSLALLEEEMDLQSGGGDLLQLRVRVAEQDQQKKVLEEDIRLLRESLQRVALVAVPARASTRERELVQHISQLADKVSEASARLDYERANAPQTREELEARIVESHAVDIGALRSLVEGKTAEHQASEMNESTLVEEPTPSPSPSPEQLEPPLEPENNGLLYEYD